MTLWLVSGLVEDPPWEKNASSGLRLDYVGMALLVLGVGALQVMLDKGQEQDWFGSPFIVTLAVLAAVGLVSLVIWEWHFKNPVVDVHLFRNFNFLSANVMMFIAGVTMFSGLVVMPQFLQLLMGYSSKSAGLVLSAGGLLLLILMPIAGTLTTRFQARYIVAAGWLLTSGAMYYSTQHPRPGDELRDRERAVGGPRWSACHSCSCRSSWSPTSDYRPGRATMWQGW